jgi:hypothetical protein
VMSCSLMYIIVFAELIYCGNILEDDSTLRSCGLKSGVMVHVLKKKEKGLYFYVCIQLCTVYVLLT